VSFLWSLEIICATLDLSREGFLQRRKEEDFSQDLRRYLGISKLAALLQLKQTLAISGRTMSPARSRERFVQAIPRPSPDFQHREMSSARNRSVSYDVSSRRPCGTLGRDKSHPRVIKFFRIAPFEYIVEAFDACHLIRKEMIRR